MGLHVLWSVAACRRSKLDEERRCFGQNPSTCSMVSTACCRLSTLRNTPRSSGEAADIPSLRPAGKCYRLPPNDDRACLTTLGMATRVLIKRLVDVQDGFVANTEQVMSPSFGSHFESIPEAGLNICDLLLLYQGPYSPRSM